MNQTSSDHQSPSFPPIRDVVEGSRVAGGLAVIVGEVLWDCFPDRSVLGGAPLNVAWNLAGFGLDPLFVSAVGDDRLGNEILETMTSWGLSTAGVRIYTEFPTGTVQVTLTDGEPHYNIVSDVAYDHLQPLSSDLREQIRLRCESSANQGYRNVLYHGSLALRSEASRNVVQQMRADWPDAVFFDVNVRQPHFELARSVNFASRTQMLKVNQHELMVLTRSQATTAEDRKRCVGDLMETLPVLQTVWLTLGAAGAECYARGMDDCFRVEAPRPSRMVDTVGAGDAFASVVLHDYLTSSGSAPADHWVQSTLTRAVTHASRVCTLSGATTTSRDFYLKFFESDGVKPSTRVSESA